MAAGKVAQASRRVKELGEMARDGGAVVVYIVALAVMIPGHGIWRGVKALRQRLRSERVRRGVLVDRKTRRLSFSVAVLLTDAQWPGPFIEAAGVLPGILDELVEERFPRGRYDHTLTNAVLLDALVLDALERLPEEVAALERGALLRRNLA